VILALNPPSRAAGRVPHGLWVDPHHDGDREGRFLHGPWSGRLQGHEESPGVLRL